MNIIEKYELSGSVTILVCTGYDPKYDILGKKLSLILGNKVRQTLTISGERKMLHQKANLDQRAFETNDIVILSPEEARSGDWYLTSN